MQQVSSSTCFSFDWHNLLWRCIVLGARVQGISRKFWENLFVKINLDWYGFREKSFFSQRKKKKSQNVNGHFRWNRPVKTGYVSIHHFMWVTLSSWKLQVRVWESGEGGQDHRGILWTSYQVSKQFYCQLYNSVFSNI